MAKAARKDPYGAFNFLVEIEGTVVAGFAEVTGLETRTDVIEYREGSEGLMVRKLPGLNKYPNITLKRGVSENRQLWVWRENIMKGQDDRRSVSIILLDRARTEVLRWNLSEAWPCKWAGPSLSARSSETAIETLELAYESLEEES